MAFSGHCGEESPRNYIGRPLSEQVKACSDIVSDALRGSHGSLVLRRCHREKSSFSCEFGCRSFIKHMP